MKILASFCNVSMPRRAALVLLDPEKFECQVLKLPNAMPNRLSVTGIAASSTHIYLALPGSCRNPSKLLIVDRTDFSLANYYEFRLVYDVHSLWLENDKLYIVSTGTDEVIELELQGSEIFSERVFWRPEQQGPRKDLYHLNAIYKWQGDIIVSGFGKRKGEVWSLSRDGLLFNVTKGKTIVSGIPHPHSLAVVGDTIAYCESANRAVGVLNKARVTNLPGYARGICCVGNYLFVGTSVGRKVSKSTGKLNSPNAKGVLAGECTVSRISIDGFCVEKTIDMSRYGDEIYELFPIDGADTWPIVSDIEFAPSEKTRQCLIEQINQNIDTLVPPGESFILVDHDLLRKELSVSSRAIPVLESRGGGNPDDSATVIREIDRLRHSGSKFIVFGWPAFWWLDYYTEVNAYLISNFHCVLRNDSLIVFDLRS